MKSSARSDYPHQKDSIDPHSSPACWWWCSRCECAISSQSVQLMSFFFHFFFLLCITSPLTSCLLENIDRGRTGVGWRRAVELEKRVCLLFLRCSECLQLSSRAAGCSPPSRPLRGSTTPPRRGSACRVASSSRIPASPPSTTRSSTRATG